MKFCDLQKCTIRYLLHYLDIPDLVRFERVNKCVRSVVNCEMKSRKMITAADFGPHSTHPISIITPHGYTLKRFDLIVLTTNSTNADFPFVESILNRCPNITCFGSSIDEISVICLHQSVRACDARCRRMKRITCQVCWSTISAVIEEVLDLCTSSDTTAVMTIVYNKKFKSRITYS